MATAVSAGGAVPGGGTCGSPSVPEHEAKRINESEEERRRERIEGAQHTRALSPLETPFLEIVRAKGAANTLHERGARAMKARERDYRVAVEAPFGVFHTRIPS